MFALLILALLLLLFFLRVSLKLVHIPGYKYKFPFGNSMEAFADPVKFSKSSHEEFSNSKVFKVWYGNEPIVVLSDEQDLKTYYAQQHLNSKPQQLLQAYPFDVLLGKSLGVLEGEQWKAIHKVFFKHLNQHSVESVIPQLEMIVSEHVQKMKSQGISNGLIFDRIQDIPLKVIIQLIYNIDSDQHELKDDIKHLAEIHGKLMNWVFKSYDVRIPFYHILPTSKNMLVSQYLQLWKNFNHKLLSKNVEPLTSIYNDCLNEGLTEENIFHTLDEIVFTNIDITAAVISWIFVHLAENPKVQAKLRDEMKICEDNYAQNSYLDAVVKESFRLQPVVAYGFPEKLGKTLKLGGKSVPKGTCCLVDFYSINHNPNQWIDHDSFIPERFLDPNLGNINFKYAQFGMGPRKCPGRYLGAALCKVLVRNFIENFEATLMSSVSFEKEAPFITPHAEIEFRIREE